MAHPCSSRNIMMHCIEWGRVKLCVYVPFFFFPIFLSTLFSSIVSPPSFLFSPLFSLSMSPLSCLSSSAVYGSMHPRALYLLCLWSIPPSTPPSPSFPKWSEGATEGLVERGKLCRECLGTWSELTQKWWSVHMALFRLRPKRKTITGTLLRFWLKRKTITGTLLRFRPKRKTVKKP